MILTYLAEKSRQDPSVIYSRQFQISMWYNDDSNATENRPYYLSQWGIDPKATRYIN